MRGILADYNVIGSLDRIVEQVFQSDDWREVWCSLRLKVFTFDALGLPRNATDERIWQVCQEQRLILFTANRNRDDETSLTAIIAAQATATSLPVVTMSDPKRFKQDRDYAERVGAKLLEILFAIEQFRGVGRVFVP